jgi:hypothetical protein
MGMAWSGFWRDWAVACVAASCLVASTESARAAGITCPPLIGNNPPISDNVTPSTGCEIGGANNDFLGGDPVFYQVNLDTMFGFSDWQFAGRAIEFEQGLDIGLSVTGGPISGTWTVDDIWTPTGIADLMFVFKGGVPKDPGNYVGYLIADGATSGVYLTPFRTPNGQGSAADISHVSAYIRSSDGGGTDGEDIVAVPEPASLLLLGGGLGLLAHGRRRKKHRG